MDKPTAALLLTLGVHVAGIAALFWLAFDGTRFDWRGWWPGDGGYEDPPGGEPDGPRGTGLPLPDADPAALRLRGEHERLAAPRRERRPAHAPEPGRTREPA